MPFAVWTMDWSSGYRKGKNRKLFGHKIKRNVCEMGGRWSWFRSVTKLTVVLAVLNLPGEGEW